MTTSARQDDAPPVPNPADGAPYCLALYQGEARVGFLPYCADGKSEPVDRYYSVAGVRRAAAKRAPEFAPLLSVVPFNLLTGKSLEDDVKTETATMPPKDEEFRSPTAVETAKFRSPTAAETANNLSAARYYCQSEECIALARDLVAAYRDIVRIVARLAGRGEDRS